MLSLFFDKFWDLAGNFIGFEHYNRLLRHKNINQAALTKNFHYLNNFFQTIIEVLIVNLCMHHITGCKTIDAFQSWLGISNWPHLITKIEAQYLEIFKVQLIYTKISKQTTINIANVLAEKKTRWLNTIPPLPEPH